MSQNNNEPKNDDLIINNIKKIVANAIKPITEKFPYSTNKLAILNTIEIHLKNRYKKYSTLDTLAFPNKQTKLDTLYEPLTLTSEDITDNNLKNIRIDSNMDLIDFLLKYRRILVEDTAGMGKSTLSKKIFNLFVEKNLGFPLLIELRHINKGNNILIEVCKQLSQNGNQINSDIASNILSTGEVLIIMDGYDEIANSDRSFVVKELLDFIHVFHDNFLIITSRPESSLVSFGSFYKFSIAPLLLSEAHSLLKRYDKYSHKPIADLLISKIEEENTISLKDFLKNPLLVSLLYKSFDYKKDIPVKKTQFYRQIFEALFEQHDYSKEGYYKRDKYSKLHLDDFERVLRYIGYLTAIHNKVEYETNYILDVVERVKTHTTDIDFKASDFIKDLLETVPLFKREGNYVKWAHKSLQDYFAAKFIWLDAKQEQEFILKKIYGRLKGEQFSNIIELFYELDTQTFESTILYWELKDFEIYVNEHIQLLNHIPIDLRKKRIANLFQIHNHVQILVTNEQDYDKFMHTDYETELGSFSKIKYGDTIIDFSHHNAKFFFYFQESQIGVISYCDLSSANIILRSVLNRIYPNVINNFRSSSLRKKLNFLEKNTLYTMDYSQDNILNSEAAFSLVNELTTFHFTFNYDEALKKLKEIEKVKSKDYTIDLLNW